MTAPRAAPLHAPRLVASAALGAPILFGLGATLLAAFGWAPTLGGDALSLEPWRALIAEPGFGASLRLTLVVGFAAPTISLALAFALLAALGSHWRRVEALLAPLLAAPHSALAIGLAFVVAPSGWAVRLFSPWATGLTAPPDVAFVGDGLGLALILGLVVKETPFLLLTSAAALSQIPAEAHMRAARALGHAPAAAWMTVVAPQLARRIRLPIAAVLVYSLSVVDMALVLAPSHPRPLALLALDGFLAPDLDRVFPAAAAATLQLALALVGLALWRLAGAALAAALRARAASGERGAALAVAIRIAAAFGGAALALGYAALAALIVWSLTWRWPFPRALPESWTLAIAARQAALLSAPLAATLAIAAATATLSLALAILWFEAEDRRGARAGAGLVYLPLLLPQLAFLYGAGGLFAALGVEGGYAAVVWAHGLFVFPYAMLTLADPWRALDPRYARAAAALGAGRRRTLLAVKLPILARPLAAAFAVGFAVSVAQYLPTLFAGGGRVATLTTEALALAGGGDRRLAAIAGCAQALLPLAVYGLANAAPRLAWRARTGLAAP